MKKILSVAALGFISATAFASETITYTYDAKGRLVRVQHSGGPAAGIDKQYLFDKADNRANVAVTGGSMSLAAMASASPKSERRE